MDEFIQRKPRPEGRNEHIQGARQEFFAHLRVILRLQCGRFHVRGANCHAPVGVSLAPVGGIQVIHLVGVRIRVGAGDKSEDPVCIRARDLAPCDFGAVGNTLGAKAGTVVTRRGDRHDELVAVCLRGVLQTAIRDGVLVQFQLIQQDNVCVEGVKHVRFVGKRFKRNLPIPDRAFKAMTEGAVQHPQAVSGVNVHGQPQPAEVIAKKTEALHVLLHRAGHGFDLAEGTGVPEAHRPAEGCGEGRLSVLPRQHRKHFLETPEVGAGVEEAADVVDHE